MVTGRIIDYVRARISDRPAGLDDPRASTVQQPQQSNGPAAWRQLAPIRLSMPPADRSLDRFRSELATRRSTIVLAPLSHLRRADGPAGTVRGLGVLREVDRTAARQGLDVPSHRRPPATPISTGASGTVGAHRRVDTEPRPHDRADPVGPTTVPDTASVGDAGSDPQGWMPPDRADEPDLSRASTDGVGAASDPERSAIADTAVARSPSPSPLPAAVERVAVDPSEETGRRRTSIGPDVGPPPDSSAVEAERPDVDLPPDSSAVEAERPDVDLPPDSSAGEAAASGGVVPFDVVALASDPSRRLDLRRAPALPSPVSPPATGVRFIDRSPVASASPVQAAVPAASHDDGATAEPTPVARPSIGRLLSRARAAVLGRSESSPSTTDRLDRRPDSVGSEAVAGGIARGHGQAAGPTIARSRGAATQQPAPATGPVARQAGAAERRAAEPARDAAGVVERSGAGTAHDGAVPVQRLGSAEGQRSPVRPESKVDGAVPVQRLGSAEGQRSPVGPVSDVDVVVPGPAADNASGEGAPADREPDPSVSAEAHSAEALELARSAEAGPSLVDLDSPAATELTSDDGVADTSDTVGPAWRQDVVGDPMVEPGNDPAAPRVDVGAGDQDLGRAVRLERVVSSSAEHDPVVVRRTTAGHSAPPSTQSALTRGRSSTLRTRSTTSRIDRAAPDSAFAPSAGVRSGTEEATPSAATTSPVTDEATGWVQRVESTADVTLGAASTVPDEVVRHSIGPTEGRLDRDGPVVGLRPPVPPLPSPDHVVREAGEAGDSTTTLALRQATEPRFADRRQSGTVLGRPLSLPELDRRSSATVAPPGAVAPGSDIGRTNLERQVDTGVSTSVFRAVEDGPATPSSTQVGSSAPLESSPTTGAAPSPDRKVDERQELTDEIYRRVSRRLRMELHLEHERKGAVGGDW